MYEISSPQVHTGVLTEEQNHINYDLLTSDKHMSVTIPVSSCDPPSVCASVRVCLLQTILVGDSGVGKTSLLVQFDQGKFIPGSFSATVGIGFTVSLSAEGHGAFPLRTL